MRDAEVVVKEINNSSRRQTDRQARHKGDLYEPFETPLRRKQVINNIKASFGGGKITTQISIISR